MPDDEIEQAMNRLREIAGKEYGGQQRLAEELDLPKQRISEYLKGQREPSLRAWLKIKEFLRKRRK
jgi:DNA-binding XRE family transcriptional regulator